MEATKKVVSRRLKPVRWLSLEQTEVLRPSGINLFIVAQRWLRYNAHESRALGVANLLLRTLGKHEQSSVTAPTVPTPPTAPVLLAPSKSTLNMEAWIAQEEKASVAELKQAVVKKMKSIARQGRVKRLGRVDTKMDRVSNYYLPSLVRRA